MAPKASGKKGGKGGKSAKQLRYLFAVGFLSGSGKGSKRKVKVVGSLASISGPAKKLAEAFARNKPNANTQTVQKIAANVQSQVDAQAPKIRPGGRGKPITVNGNTVTPYKRPDGQVVLKDKAGRVVNPTSLARLPAKASATAQKPDAAVKKDDTSVTTTAKQEVAKRMEGKTLKERAAEGDKIRQEAAQASKETSRVQKELNAKKAELADVVSAKQKALRAAVTKPKEAPSAPKVTAETPDDVRREARKALAAGEKTININGKDYGIKKTPNNVVLLTDPKTGAELNSADAALNKGVTANSGKAKTTTKAATDVTAQVSDSKSKGILSRVPARSISDSALNDIERDADYYSRSQIGGRGVAQANERLYEAVKDARAGNYKVAIDSAQRSKDAARQVLLSSNPTSEQISYANQTIKGANSIIGHIKGLSEGESAPELSGIEEAAAADNAKRGNRR